MTISSITNSAVQQLWWQQVSALSSASDTDGTSQSGVQSVGSEGVSVELSEPGKIFSKLQQLAESDPEQFETLMTDIADQIEEAAESATDEDQSSMLKEMAQNFRDAAESGDVSALRPPPPPKPSDNANGEMVNAYTQNRGSSSFGSVMDIVKEIVDEAVSSI